jgi:predicted exporter
VDKVFIVDLFGVIVSSAMILAGVYRLRKHLLLAMTTGASSTGKLLAAILVIFSGIYGVLAWGGHLLGIKELAPLYMLVELFQKS